ncbi:MAG: hypothetical protein RR513_09415 [Muribaculaceae bacterium]
MQNFSVIKLNIIKRKRTPSDTKQKRAQRCAKSSSNEARTSENVEDVPLQNASSEI